MPLKSLINKEVEFGYLPALKNERQFGMWDFILIQVGFGIAAWCFMVGGLTGTVLPGKLAIPVILLGNALPVFLIAPLVILFARYGVETFAGARAALGYLGSDIFFVIFAVLNLGWIVIATFMLGESVIKIMAAVNAPEFLTTRTVGAPIFSIIAFAVGVFIAYRGPIAIKLFTRIGVPSLILILLGLAYVVIVQNGFDVVLNSEPAGAYDTMSRSVASALEWNVGLGFSWLPYLGQWARMAKTEKTAYYGTFYGFGIILNIAGIFGAFVALLVGSLDPTDWMIAVGGVTFGIFGLLLLVLANLTSTIVLIYSQALSFKTIFPDKKWGLAIASTMPAALLMLSPAVYDSYSTFLSYVSFTMAAYGGVLIADYFLVRKSVINVRELYNRGGIYQYQGGVNVMAYAVILLTSVFYFWTYNPVSDQAGPLFTFISAGIPTFFLSALLYFAASKLFPALVAPKGVPIKDLNPA